MRIRIFRALTLAEAMAQVRDELGLDALILSTETRAGIVEVTAALEPEDDPDLGEPLTAASAKSLSGAPAAGAISALSDGEPLLRHNLPAGLLSALTDGPLEAACSRLFRFSRLPLDADAPPLLLAGPPGSGKTLTVAKLATRLVMEGHRPMVITADEQRAGAVEQLAAFTRLLGLTLIAAGRPEILSRALDRREALSPVLIDAPGLDLLDSTQDALLTELIAASDARPVLVLPAGMDSIETTEIAEAHAARGAQLMVPTRIDRGARLGGILAACHAACLALTEAGTGTNVADGLTQLTPVSLASRLIAMAPARMAIPKPIRAPAELGTSSQTDPQAPRRGALSMHIAAQSGQTAQASAHRLPLWKTNP